MDPVLKLVIAMPQVFLWTPVIKAEETSWDAREEFDGPRPAPQHLTAWEQYAQVLLLANEFAFVD